MKILWIYMLFWILGLSMLLTVQMMTGFRIGESLVTLTSYFVTSNPIELGIMIVTAASPVIVYAVSRLKKWRGEE